MLPPTKSSIFSLCLLFLSLLLLLFSYFIPECSNVPFKLKLCPLLSDPYYLDPQHCHGLNPLTSQYYLYTFLCASYSIFKILWPILNFILNSGNIFSKNKQSTLKYTNQSWQKQVLLQHKHRIYSGFSYISLQSTVTLQTNHYHFSELQQEHSQVLLDLGDTSCNTGVRGINQGKADPQRIEKIGKLVCFSFRKKKKGKAIWKDGAIKWGQPECRERNPHTKT